jgi:acetylornithine deacetylase/succinyl-diaminopimelate desuccinylase-like protein
MLSLQERAGIAILYEPEIRDGNIYARGASDDKGPTMACYYGLKILKELNVPLTKNFALSQELMKNQVGATWITISRM